MPRTLVLVLLMALLGVASCQVQAVGGHNGAASGNSARVSLPELPAPALLKATAGCVTGLVRYGDQPGVGLPRQYVVAQTDQSAIFTPDPAGAGGLDGPAYAVYAFNAEGFALEGRVCFDWQEAADYGDVWAGIPAPDDTHWHWLPVPPSGEVAYDIATTLNGPEEYVAVVCLGAQPWRLHSVYLSVVGEPGILEVTPAGGEAGTNVQFCASIDGTVYGTWAWDFGGGAMPNTSAVVSPTVRLGPAGEYAAQLTITNPYHIYKYEWNLVVTGVTELYTVSGVVTKADGTPYSDCHVELSGTCEDTKQTGADGAYEFRFLQPGPYKVVATGAAFMPPEHNITLVDADLPGQDFQQDPGETIDITGAVRNPGPFGSGISGIELQLSGPVESTAFTGTGGKYTFANLPDGAYSITPVQAGYYYAPEHHDVTIAGASVPGVNFVASTTPVSTYTISGKVTDAATGSPLAGWEMQLSRFWTMTTQTGADGKYEFTGLPFAAYSVTPADPGPLWIFAPQALYVETYADTPDIDFVRTAK